MAGEIASALDVTPSSASPDVRDGAWCHAEPACESRSRFRTLSNRPDLLAGQRCLPPAPGVLRARDQLEVVGVDACSVPAEVVRLESLRDRAVRALVGEAMGKAVSEAAVPLRVAQTAPYEATRRSVDDVALVEVEPLEALAMAVDVPLPRPSVLAAAAFASHRPNISGTGGWL